MIIGFQEVNVQYCNCQSLPETLMRMHFFPSSAVTPNIGIHFSLIEWLHTFKMNAFVSNHGFVKSFNDCNAVKRNVLIIFHLV